MKNSPVPWTSFDYGAHDALINYCVASGGFSEKADADRAVACVNACSGIPTEGVAEIIAAMRRILPHGKSDGLRGIGILGAITDLHTVCQKHGFEAEENI